MTSRADSLHLQARATEVPRSVSTAAHSTGGPQLVRRRRGKNPCWNLTSASTCRVSSLGATLADGDRVPERVLPASLSRDVLEEANLFALLARVCLSDSFFLETYWSV
ncbi:hypothetical protein BaRGS_00022042 [Batillaria attramentaria]|uniref:Uncharacterized protein n=1 Tax=Batillaria attramentaria TaxID=370345 RepID=A0ABD0KHP1_9CAEN